MRQRGSGDRFRTASEGLQRASWLTALVVPQSQHQTPAAEAVPSWRTQMRSPLSWPSPAEPGTGNRGQCACSVSAEPGRGGARIQSGRGLKPLLRSPAHSPLDVGVIVLQEFIVFLPVLKNVLNETACEPHRDKSGGLLKAPPPTPFMRTLGLLGSFRLCTPPVMLTQFRPTTTLQSGR